MRVRDHASFPLPVKVVDCMAFSSFSLGGMLVDDDSEGSLPLTSRSVELSKYPYKSTCG